MDTPPNNLKSWSALTARARLCAPPEIDVRLAVRRALPGLPTEASVSENFPAQLACLTRSGWFAGSLAVLALLAGASSYLGLRALPELALALGLGLSF